MSFGWSAGDVASAIVIIVKVLKALDSVDGAPRNYRKAAAFLESLKCTLVPLQTFTALEIYPEYGDRIRECVESIKGPIETFLISAKKFEASLGVDARDGRHRYITEKLRWRFMDSKVLERLKEDIGDHIIILNNLLHQLTLDTVFRLQNNLKTELRTTLQENILPLRAEIQENQQMREQQHTIQVSEIQQRMRVDIATLNRSTDNRQSVVISKLEQQDMFFTAEIEALKKYISNIIQYISIQRQQERDLPIRIKRSYLSSQDESTLEMSMSTLRLTSAETAVQSESLQKLYYQILLYFGQLLRNLLFILWSKLRPSAALTPILIAKYHISFYDSLGRPPRILDYSCFINYKVFRAFLQDYFSGRPGESWINRELFHLTNAKNGSTITPSTWSRMISPGSIVNMSMLINQYLASNLKSQNVCPMPGCSGIIQTSSKSLGKCSICEVEVITSENEAKAPRMRSTQEHILEALKLDEDDETLEGFQSHSENTSSSRVVGNHLDVDEFDPDEEMIHFKRLAILKDLISVNSADGSDDDISKPVSSGMGPSFKISDSTAVEEFYFARFKDMQAISCKIIAKAFVKIVEPKKQIRYPYTNRDNKAPPWWPKAADVRHKEPDHLMKLERIRLLVHILRMAVERWERQHPRGQKTVVNIKMLWELTIEALKNPPNNEYRPINFVKWSCLHEIFKVARAEERYKNGEIDGDTLVYLSYREG